MPAFRAKFQRKFNRFREHDPERNFRLCRELKCTQQQDHLFNDVDSVCFPIDKGSMTCHSVSLERAVLY